MATAKSVEKKEIIAEYQLWKVKIDEYRNRNKKDVAYEKLAEKNKKIDPKAERAAVLTTILRTSYHLELKIGGQHEIWQRDRR